MIGIHFVAALIYVGITFRFQKHNSRVYVAWYVVGGCEALINIMLSLIWDVLSFRGTHLIQRFSLLTFIIMGEGIIEVTNNISLIVKNSNSWSKPNQNCNHSRLIPTLTTLLAPPTIGNITAAIANLYIVYMIYFDWMCHLHLPAIRQLIWAGLHFPFHLALTLFVEGAAQFVSWWKILETLFGFDQTLYSAFANADNPNFNVTTAWFVDTLNQTVNDLFNLYEPKYYDTYVDVADNLATLANISDSFWTTPWSDSDPEAAIFNETATHLFTAVQNSLFASFGIDPARSIAENFTGTSDSFQDAINEENQNRFYIMVRPSKDSTRTFIPRTLTPAPPSSSTRSYPLVSFSSL
jgi:hypothetical protein